MSNEELREEADRLTSEDGIPRYVTEDGQIRTYERTVDDIELESVEELE